MAFGMKRVKYLIPCLPYNWFCSFLPGQDMHPTCLVSPKNNYPPSPSPKLPY